MPNQTKKDAAQSLERGLAQSGVRLANERAVFALVALNPGSSNADLARMSGLGPQTTSRIVAELEAHDLVIRGEVLRGKRGQPATPLFLNPEAAYCFGVELGWRHYEVLLVKMSGEVLDRVRHSYAYPDARTVFNDIASEILKMREGLSSVQQARVIGVGLACPTNIEWNVLKVGAPEEQVELWRDLDVSERLAAATGMVVQVLNDGDAACWSELIALPRPRPQSFAYFQIGTFIGAGIVTNREIWSSPNGDAANLGGMIVSGSDGAPNYLFKIGSMLSFEERLQNSGLAVPQGAPADWDWSVLEAVTGPWVDETGSALAQAVLTTVAFVNVQMVVFDGLIPRPIFDRIFERLQYHLDRLPFCSLERPQIGKGQMGVSAAAIGVAQRMLYDRFFSRAWTLFATSQG